MLFQLFQKHSFIICYLMLVSQHPAASASGKQVLLSCLFLQVTGSLKCWPSLLLCDLSCLMNSGKLWTCHLSGCLFLMLFSPEQNLKALIWCSVALSFYDLLVKSWCCFLSLYALYNFVYTFYMYELVILNSYLGNIKQNTNLGLQCFTWYTLGSRLGYLLKGPQVM